jgi:hypothetical protein
MESDDYVSHDTGVYFKDTNNNLDKFEGTWIYEDATRKLTIVLQKKEFFEIGSPHSDVVIGNYIYEENGVELINTLTNPAASQGSDDIYHIEMYGFRNSSKIVGDFEDPIRSKWADYTLYLTFDSSDLLSPQPKLLWNIHFYEFYNPDGDLDATQELRVPSLLTLTKVQ